MAVFIAGKVIGDPGDDAELSSLLDGVRAGRTADYERLVTRMQERVRRWATRFTDDADTAEDIAQDVLISLETRVHQFSGRSRFTTWLFTVTRRVALTHRRRELRRSELRDEQRAEVSAPAHDGDADQDRRTLAALVLRYFDALPPKQRQIFELVDLRGAEPAEVARRLGMRQVTVRANLFKARRTIRMHMLAHHERMLKEYRS